MNLQIMLSKLQHIQNHLAYAGSLLLFDIRLDQAHIGEMENCKNVLAQQRDLMKKIHANQLQFEHSATESSLGVPSSRYLLYSKEFEFGGLRPPVDIKQNPEERNKTNSRWPKKSPLNGATLGTSHGSSQKQLDPSSPQRLSPIRTPRADFEANNGTAKKEKDHMNLQTEDGMDGTSSSAVVRTSQTGVSLRFPRIRRRLLIDTGDDNMQLQRDTGNKGPDKLREHPIRPTNSPISAGASSGVKKNLEAISLHLVASKRFERARSDDDIKGPQHDSFIRTRRTELTLPAGSSLTKERTLLSEQRQFKEDSKASSLGVFSSRPKSILSPNSEAQALKTFRDKLYKAVVAVMRPTNRFLTAQSQTDS